MDMRISQWKAKAIFTAVYLGAVALLFRLGITCIFRQYLGFVCPGCGMTRAILSVLRLDFVAAFRYHPMFWSMPILYLYFLLDKGLFREKRWNTLLLSGIGVGFLVQWLIKLF